MFNCSSCGLTAPPRSKPTFTILAVAKKEYLNHNAEGETVVSTGTEIVEAGLVCRICTHGSELPASDNAVGVNVAAVRAAHYHAAGCKKALGECHVCTRNMEFLNSIPLRDLSIGLSEPSTETAAFQLATLVVDSTFDKGTQRSKRAARDKIEGMRFLKCYQDLGGKLRS